MEQLAAVLDEADVPPSDAGPVARIRALAAAHPDNLHLNTFDEAHYRGMSEDEQGVFCWCLRTDLSDLQSQAQSEDEKAELPLGALAAVGLAIALVTWFGKAAVMWVVVGGTALSIGSAFIFVEGRSAAEEELQEERDGYQSPLVQALLARLRRCCQRQRHG